MRHVIPPRLDDRLDGRGRLVGFEEAIDHRAAALQRRERRIDDAARGRRAEQHLGVAVLRRLFVAPHDVLRRALEGWAPLFVAFQTDNANPAAGVRDMDTFNRVWASGAQRGFDHQVSGYHPGVGISDRPEQLLLHDVARGLARGPAGPGFNRRGETSPRPPVGIAAGGMTDQLERARFRLAHAVCRHEQPFFVARARLKEGHLLRIVRAAQRPVVGEQPPKPTVFARVQFPHEQF